MLRLLLLGLLVLWLAFSRAYAQGPNRVVEPWETGMQLRRLPPTDPVPAYEAEYVPARDVDTALGSTLAEEIWQGSLQLGLIGSEGNTESFNLRAGIDAQRKTDRNTFTTSLDYYRRTSNAIRFVRDEQSWRAVRAVRYARTRNRIYGRGLFEHLFSHSPGTSFVVGTMDYDEGQPFDVRFTTHLGLGYRFVDTATTSLIGRTGGGFSHEVDSPDTRYVPEALLELQLDYRIGRRQKLTGRSGYYPNLSDFSEFRMEGELAWETVISEEMNLSFKLRVLDRYDSTPYGSDPNDLDYSALIVWKI